MGLGGGQLPPHFLKKSTKSQTFLSVFTTELLLIKLKSHSDLVSAPPLFFENDAPDYWRQTQISLWINLYWKIQNRLDSKVVFRFSGILQLRNQVTWIVDEFCNLSGSTSNIILCWVVDWSEMIQNRFWWNFCNITKNRLITEWMNFGTCCE